MKIFVTGAGIISATGNNLQENLSSLINSKSGIGNITFLDTIHKHKIPVGEVKLTDEELIHKISAPKGVYTRTSLLGMAAAKEAVSGANIDIKKYRVGLISATTVAGMGKSEIYYGKFLKEDYKNDYIKTHEGSDSTEKIADFLDIKKFLTTISTACSSAANAIMLGARLIKNNSLDAVIVGGVDSLSKFTLNGFKTLMIFDSEKCKLLRL